MNYIRNIYKSDYRGYESKPIRRSGVTEKYSIKSHRLILKTYLEEDFQYKCVYCGWNSEHYDSASFHIEHVKSRSENPSLEDDYNNLVLSCPICNTSKNKKQLPSELDPISNEFSELFYRNHRGAIVINNTLSSDKKILSNKYISTIGLSKELYKLDYVYSSLNKIKQNQLVSKSRNDNLIIKIIEIIDFIDHNYSRRSNFTF